MNCVKSLSPIAYKSARILVLGSMPGVLSLKKNQYFAHPRNAFWKIMGSVFNFDSAIEYVSRMEALKSSGVALWDVLHACVRNGSLDSSIESGSRVPNNFDMFFKGYPDIKLVAFNGAEAEKSFNLYVSPGLDVDEIEFVRLPSSSPAHAVKLENKIRAWREALNV